MGSEQRQRAQGVFVRMDDTEKAWLVEQSSRLDITPAELARALIFDRRPATPVVSCSPFHENCNHQHRALVDSYREQRQREELDLESETGAYRGDIELWEANGGRLTTFHDWLKAFERNT